jgi:hypothetical protein
MIPQEFLYRGSTRRHLDEERAGRSLIQGSVEHLEASRGLGMSGSWIVLEEAVVPDDANPASRVLPSL